MNTIISILNITKYLYILSILSYLFPTPHRTLFIILPLFISIVSAIAIKNLKK